MSSQDSLRGLLDRWRSGDETAATDIYRRYEQRLLRLAEWKIGPHLQARIDPDDVILSVLNTVLKRIKKGQYSVDPSGSLWNLLQVVTSNKVRKQGERHTAGKRDVNVEVAAEPAELPLEAIPKEPSPEEAAVLADELERIRQRLKPGDFEVFQLQFQGYSYPEIARQIGCARQTVRYKSRRIEELLRQWASDDSGP